MYLRTDCSDARKLPRVTNTDIVRFQVLMALNKPVVVLRIVTPCGLVCGCRRFGDKCRLLLQDDGEIYEGGCGMSFRNVGDYL